jgi:hypothetical protein
LTWVGNSALKDFIPEDNLIQSVPVKDIISTFDSNPLRVFLPHHILDHIDNIFLDGMKDKPIWSPQPLGSFSISSAYHLNFACATAIPMFKHLWCLKLPLHITLYAWCILYQRLPTYDNICKLGILIVSKCSCCPYNPSTKTIKHIFCRSELVLKISKWVFQKSFISPIDPEVFFSFMRAYPSHR